VLDSQVGSKRKGEGKREEKKRGKEGKGGDRRG
jgi:hypothetical protein